MILLIICGILVVVGLIFLLLGCKNCFNDYDRDEFSAISGGTVGVVGFIGLLVCSIIAIVHNNNIYKYNKRIEYQERINSINNTRKALEDQLQASTLTILEVSTYNETVREFKTELKQDQMLLNSPWIGCLCCNVCSEFSVDAVNYLYID